jgi:hypothetical protein
VLNHLVTIDKFSSSCCSDQFLFQSFRRRDTMPADNATLARRGMTVTGFSQTAFRIGKRSRSAITPSGIAVPTNAEKKRQRRNSRFSSRLETAAVRHAWARLRL